MKITSIETQRDKTRVNIYIDDKFAFGISEEIRFKHGLTVDQDIEDNFIQDILLYEEQFKATNYALNLLSYRQRSEKEIFTALKRKGYEEQFINKAIEYCKENKYIDDLTFAKSFINDKINLNKLGPNRIKYELLNKGISKDIIDKTLRINSHNEYEAALIVATKKFNSYKGQDQNAIYRKLGGYLQRKGYSFDVISKILGELLKDEEIRWFYVLCLYG